MLTSINRIRLEFKDSYIGFTCFCESRINRIRLEFKDDHKQDGRKPLLVLIESDWNLKLDDLLETSEGILVLIESDWNLKYMEVFEYTRKGARINRIRLEFKVDIILILDITMHCINRIRLEFKERIKKLI